MTRPRRTFTDAFKLQMVKLYETGKPRKDIVKEYDLTPSALDKWITQSQSSNFILMRHITKIYRKEITESQNMHLNE